MANEVEAVGGAGAAKGTDRLGTERIGRLLLEFSIPAIISMVFNSLYNVVDTAFLGQAFPDGTGVAVTTLALPVMTILMGFSMVAGQGGNALAAIQLGEGRKAQVEKTLGNSAVLLFGLAVLVAVAAVWNMIFNPSMGPINMILNQFFGVAVENLPRWAAGKDTAMITVILFSVWKNMGYYMVIYLAGLQGCNPDLNEAAELDGANRWQQFWHITLPQLRPTTFFVVIMLTISGFKVYDQMYMITQGGPGTATMTLVYYIYNVAFVNTPKYGYASAISMVLFVLVLIVTIIQFRGSKGEN